MDLKKALEAAHSVGRRDLTLGEVSLPNGTVFRNVQIDSDRDARQFQFIVDGASRAIAPHVVKAPAGAIATGATIFEGFYDLSIEGQAAVFAAKTKVCGRK